MMNLREGKGDLGKLLMREDLYFQAQGIFSKVSTVMNDVNHYGLLFHLDKGWQRARTKRMNLLNEIETASQFRQYFESEVDQITTSLSRVSMLLELAQNKPEKIEGQQEFMKGFSDLLRQVQLLESGLKIYNEEYFEQSP